MQLSVKKIFKKWLTKLHLISLAIKLNHIYWGIKSIFTSKKILASLGILTYVYSQKNLDKSFAGEAKSLKSATKHIYDLNKYCVDIAASNGVEMSSTLQFYRDGWGGIAVEFDPERFSQLAFCYKEFGAVTLLRKKVTPTNVAEILISNQTPECFGVLNLDIDSYDLEVLIAIFQHGYRPTVISMEINEKIPPGIFFNVRYTPSHSWSGDHFYGCSLTAASSIIRPYGYMLIDLSYNNAIYVHKDVKTFSKDIFLDLQDKVAYELGYQFAINRKEMFPQNDEMEFLLDLEPEQAVSAIVGLFAKYPNKFDLWIEHLEKTREI